MKRLAYIAQWFHLERLAPAFGSDHLCLATFEPHQRYADLLGSSCPLDVRHGLSLLSGPADDDALNSPVLQISPIMRQRRENDTKTTRGFFRTLLWGTTPSFPLPPWLCSASRAPSHRASGLHPGRRRTSTLAPPGSPRRKEGRANQVHGRMRGPLRSPLGRSIRNMGRWWGPTCPGGACQCDRAATILLKHKTTVFSGSVNLQTSLIVEPRPSPRPPERSAVDAPPPTPHSRAGRIF